MHRFIKEIKVCQPNMTRDDDPNFLVTVVVATSDPIKMQSLISAACFEIEDDDRQAKVDAKSE